MISLVEKRVFKDDLLLHLVPHGLFSNEFRICEGRACFLMKP